MRAGRFRATILRAAAAILVASLTLDICSATILVSDGFGDGDRDNNGLDAGASVTDPSDVGIPWRLTDGTSAVTFKAIDDTSGLGSGNALQLFNTSANNRPTVGHFSPVTMGDGDKLILRFDARLLSVKNTGGTDVTADRAIRFGLYHDTNNNTSASGDTGSGGTTSTEDVGYNVRVDAGADVSNSTSMDVTRDDSTDTSQIIQGTTTGLSISSSNTSAQFLAAGAAHHIELSLTRSGSNMQISLQNGSVTISGTDTSTGVVGFTFDEVALGLRSTAAMDMRFDNIEVEYIQAVPEAAPLCILMVALVGMILNRRRQQGTVPALLSCDLSSSR